jgi:hypothetical protein
MQLHRYYIVQKPSRNHSGVADRKSLHMILKQVQIREVYRIPQWLADWIKNKGGAGRKIEKAFIAQYGLTTPE